jgi:DNA repair protein RadC
MIENLVCSMETSERFTRYAVQVALVREPLNHDRPKLDSPEAVFETFKGLACLDRECVAVALLDSAHRLNGIHAVHVGSTNQSVVGIPDVFKAAILANARGIVLVHNHPSGNPEPSRDDIELTNRLKSAGELIGIPVMDHVIVANGGWTSLYRRLDL